MSHKVVSRYERRIGERIGMLKFTGISGRRGDGNRIFATFKCDCGRVAEFPAGRVLNKRSRTHCGCKTDRGTHRTHGMRWSPEYSSWSAMKARCMDPSNKDYPRWGGIGITVCPEWANSFEAFYAHVGPRPRGTTLDRLDNAKGYAPGNVRWATAHEQQSNRRCCWVVEIDGVTYPTQSAAAKAHGVSMTTIAKWCEGYKDPRREHLTSGGKAPPKADCHRRRAYEHY